MCHAPHHMSSAPSFHQWPHGPHLIRIINVTSAFPMTTNDYTSLATKKSYCVHRSWGHSSEVTACKVFIERSIEHLQTFSIWMVHWSYWASVTERTIQTAGRLTFAATGKHTECQTEFHRQQSKDYQSKPACLTWWVCNNSSYQWPWAVYIQAV